MNDGGNHSWERTGSKLQILSNIKLYTDTATKLFNVSIPKVFVRNK